MSCRNPATARSRRRSSARSLTLAVACRSTSHRRPARTAARRRNDAPGVNSDDAMGEAMSTQENVLVTGGASGIGLAIVRAVVAEGWRAMVADLVQQNLDQARETLGQSDELVRFEQLDVADEGAVTRAITRCEAEFGPLTGLVNSAGIASDTPAIDTPASLFRRILEVNLIGSFVACREAA